MKKLEDDETVQNGWGLYIAIVIILLMWFGFSGCGSGEVTTFKKHEDCDYIKFEGYYGWSHSGTCPNPIHKCKCD